MKKLIIIGGGLVLLLIACVLVWQHLRHKGVSFDVRYIKTVSVWTNKVYVPMKPYDGVIASKLSAAKIQDANLLTTTQREALLNSIMCWFKAYSAGSKEGYLAFRLPPGVPWEWKNGKTEIIFNYFVNGKVFDTDFLMDAWMRRYGDPDKLADMVPYASSAKTWTEQEKKDIRKRWIEKYGDGSAAKTAPHPTDPLEQWLTIANESAGTNWWLDYWTGACIDEMVICISKYSEFPKPLFQYPFGPIQKRTGYNVDAPFQNMGISRLDIGSYIEWKFTYQDILDKQGSILTANILCFFSRLNEFPQPALLRLVYVDEYVKWVPFEMVDANIMKGKKDILFF